MRDRPSPHPWRDAGFTMVEMLVGMGLFSLLGTLLLGFALSTARVSSSVSDAADVTEESRLAIERMGREVRQARGLRGAVVTAGKVTAITLEIDFDGNGVIDTTATDPEVLTYRFDPAAKTLTLTGNDLDGSAVTRPVLAGGVQDVDIRLRSSRWMYDTNNDGTTTWQEIDASTVGDQDDTPDGPELDLIDLVSVRLTVVEGATSRTFTVQADMRNRELGQLT